MFRLPSSKSMSEKENKLSIVMNNTQLMNNMVYL